MRSGRPPEDFYRFLLTPYVGLSAQKPTFKTGLVFRGSVYTPQQKRQPGSHLFVVYHFLGMSQSLRPWQAGSLFRVASASLLPFIFNPLNQDIQV